MPRYQEVVAAAGETATKILAQRLNQTKRVCLTTNGGETASVVWSDTSYDVTLNMPTLPPELMLTRAEADRLVGYIAHECCHVIHTSWRAWQRAVMGGDQLRALTNCIEDVRIERKEIRAGHYPALRSLLASLATQKHGEAVAKATAEGVTIGSKMAHMPYVLTILGRMANGYSIPTAHRLRADLDPTVAKAVDEALRAMPGLKSTDDARELARRLLAMADQLKADQPPASPPVQPSQRQDGAGEAQDGAGEAQEAPGDQDGAGEAQEAPGDQDGAGEAQEAPGDQDGAGEAQEAPGDQDGAGEAPAAPEDQDPPPGIPQGTGGNDAGSPFSGGDEIDPDDLRTMLEKAAERMSEAQREESRKSFAHLLPLARNRVHRWTSYRTSYNTTAAQQLEAPLARTSVLHGQIARLLVSEEKHERTHFETTGRLDRRALVRMRTGTPDVFSQRRDTPAVQTALIVLVDRSGSMDRDTTVRDPQTGGSMDRMGVARCTAWAIAKAAEDANAKVAVIGFTSLGIGGDTHTGAALDVCKGFDEPCSVTAAQVRAMTTAATTPLSPAILECARMLQDIPASRRIVMVLTDGMCNYRAGAVKAACTLADDMGVEVVGIGIAAPEAIAAFPDGYSVNVANMDQLATTGLGQLVHMLEDAQEARR